MGVSAADRRPGTTRVGVEMTVAWTFVGLRAVDLTQCLVAVAAGSLAKSTDAALDLTVIAVVVAESLLLCRWLISRRSLLPARWPVAVDLAAAIFALGSSALYVPVDARGSQWTMWAFAFTLSTVALIGGSLIHWQYALAGAGVLMATYLAVVALPAAGNASEVATAATNSIAYPGFAAVAYVFARFVRRLAHTADEAKARVAELERERSRARVHNLLPYLKWDRFAEADHQTQLAMLEQARTAYQETRSYVDATQDPQTLDERFAAALDLHRTLTVRTVLDLEQNLELSDEVLERVREAVDTALANVEQHARGAAVVLSACSRSDRIEVVIHDDGPGFDATQVQPGFGIAEILERQLAAVGGSGTVRSTPGGGTEVRITVPAPDVP